MAMLTAYTRRLPRAARTGTRRMLLTVQAIRPAMVLAVMLATMLWVGGGNAMTAWRAYAEAPDTAPPVSAGIGENVPEPLQLYHQSANPKVDAYVEAAHQALYQGQEALAEHLLLQAVGEARLMPEDPKALSYATTTLGRLYEAIHQFEKAAAVYHEGLVLQRRYDLASQWSSMERLAQVYEAMGQTGEAVVLYQQLIDHYRNQLALLSGKDNLLESMPLPMTAPSQEVGQWLVQLARVYRLQASAYFQAGNDQAGLESALHMLDAIERAHFDEPLKRFGPYMLLGRWYGKAGQSEKAIFWSLRGIRTAEAGLKSVSGTDMAEADEPFAAVIQAQLPGAYEQLAELYRQANQLLRSQDMHRKAEQLMGN